VWAFIPYNLLPKLRTLYDGQSVEQFEYFVDSSPKLAEVKLNGSWRSLLIFGQGPGGTFYQCFDVTEAGMGVSPELDSLSDVNNLLQRFDTPDESIVFKWAFPHYGHFDPTIKQTFTLSDGSPGNKLVLWGDLNASANYVEKTVGFTWSDPAVGPLDAARDGTAVMMGSGYFPAIESLLPNRGAAAPRAGTTMYLLDADSGDLFAGDGSWCATYPASTNGCLSVPDVSNGRKNALQADPTAAGTYGSPAVTKAYMGDVDGRYWRFNFTSAGVISASLMADTGQPIYASSALLFVGSTDVYMFVATGSDSLPVTTSGGTGTFKLYGFKDNSSSADTKFAINLGAVTQSGGLANGERPSTSPTVAGDIVFYTSTNEVASTPCVDFTANLYAVTYSGSAAYDADNNGRLDNNESNIVRTATGRATAPFIVDQHLYFATSAGSGGAGSGNGGSTGDRTGAKIEAFGDSEDFNNGVGQVGVRILSWREIR
jgi:Tfp pilus tip-associated adhesin PilY1